MPTFLPGTGRGTIWREAEDGGGVGTDSEPTPPPRATRAVPLPVPGRIWSYSTSIEKPPPFLRVTTHFFQGVLPSLAISSRIGFSNAMNSSA